MDQKRRYAYTEYIIICESFGSKEKFYKASDAASQYSFFPIIIQILHSLGLSQKNHLWITVKKLIPEDAIEYLIKMGKQKDNLLLIKEDMDTTTQHIFDPANSATKRWMPHIGLYQYLIGEEAVGKEILKDGGSTHWHTFFAFATLVANENLGQSITSVKDFLARNKNNLSRGEREVRIKILPLLALVHKRLADKETCDTEKTRHLKLALLYLSTLAPTHKELYLSIAIIQEQLNDLKSAYASYTKLEKHCNTFPKESAENCQLQLISQAKEKLQDRMLNSPDNTPTEESALQKPEKDDIPITRKKPQKTILTTQIPQQLTPEEEEEEGIIVPFASLRMDKSSDADFEIKEPTECIQNLALKSEECVQEYNDTNWTLVRKKATPYFKIPHAITNEAFE